MEEHYAISFFEDPLSTEDLTGKPFPDNWVQMKPADSAILYFFGAAELLRQKLVLKKYHFELIQCKCEMSLSFRYSVNGDRLFFLFVLDGDIGFSTENGAEITKAKKNSFYPSHNSRGTYHVNIPTDSTVSTLVVSLDPKWAKDIVRPYPELREALTGMLTSERQFSIMPRCRIDTDLKEILLAFFEVNDQNRGIVKLQLREKIAFALSHYYKKLLETGWVAIYNIRLYMEKHYREPLDMNTLAEMGSLTEGAFQKKFKLIYAITPYDYIIKLRMIEASRLISQMGMPMKEVYLLVGYRDLGNFRKAYKAFMNSVSSVDRI